MTVDARMSPEREAELRAEHVFDSANDTEFCRGCDWYLPCPVIESLDALAAERDAVAEERKVTALAQKELQDQLDRSSSAVLGYVVFIPAGHMIIGQEPNDGPFPTLGALRDVINIDPDDQVVAVVRVGADGRIGS